MKAQFPDDGACLQAIFDARYGELKACPKCGVVNVTYYRVKNRMSFVCKECRHQIYPLVGTIFEKSTTPLTDWFHAIYLFSVSKNGVSAKEIERIVGVSYKTAHRMAKMIRTVMAENGKLGFMGTPVEADELYIGGRRKQTEVKDNKTPLLAALEVGGHVRTQVVTKAVASTILPFMLEHLYDGAILHTDESKSYHHKEIQGRYSHSSVRHIAKEFVSKSGVTTNPI
jgi:transposase